MQTLFLILEWIERLWWLWLLGLVIFLPWSLHKKRSEVMIYHFPSREGKLNITNIWSTQRNWQDSIAQAAAALLAAALLLYIFRLFGL